MKIFCDTSVLVRAFWKEHSTHSRAAAILQRVKGGTDRGYVAAHTLAETFAVLTGMPAVPRVSPSMAFHLLSHDVLPFFVPIMLAPRDYVSTLEDLAFRGFSGGGTFDALLVTAARIVGPDRFYSFNAKDFLRFAPDWSDIIQEP